MQDSILNIDSSTVIHITGIYSGHSFEIKFEQFEKNEVTAKPFDAGNYTMVIYQDKALTNSVETLQEGDGLTVSGNKLTIIRKTQENKLQPGRHWYHIYNEVSSELSASIFNGYLDVKPGR